MSASATQSFSAFVTKDRQTVYLGIFTSPRKVVRAHVEVLTAFDGSGTDQIRIGHATDDDAYGVLVDVSTTGIKTVTLGAGVGYDITPRQVIAQYVAGSGLPSNGSAIVTLEFIQCPLQLS